MWRQTKQYNSKNIKDSIKQNKQNILVKKLCKISHLVEARKQGLACEGECEEVSFEGLFEYDAMVGAWWMWRVFQGTVQQKWTMKTAYREEISYQYGVPASTG